MQSKFCKRDYDRLGIETLSKRGYSDIEIWDFSCCFRPSYFKTYTPTDSLSGENYINIQTKNFAMQLLQSLQTNSVFICLISVNSKSAYIFNYLNKKNYNYGFLSVGHIPLVSNSFFTRAKRAVKNPGHTLKWLIDLIKVKTYALELPIYADFIFLGGAIATSNYISDKTTLLKTHTLDYDSFLNSNRLLELKRSDRYAVFLDQAMSWHPDHIGDQIISPTYYFRSLNIFFEYIESKLGLKVIIAPHPRANYIDTKNPFNGRSIVNQSTNNIVRNSELVITHYTTAVSFAVLHNKPILFLNDKAYPSGIQKNIDHMANFFNKNAIEISELNFVIDENFLAIDNEIYYKYKELYIKEGGTPEKQTWDVFSDYLDEAYAR